MLFFFYRQPYGALAEVDILFHPPQHNKDDGEENVKLWVWTHPSAHTHIVEAFTEVLHLHKVPASNKDVSESSGKAVVAQEELGDKEPRGDSDAEEYRKSEAAVPGKDEVAQHTDVEAEECRKELSGDDASEQKHETVPGREVQDAQRTRIETMETKVCKQGTSTNDASKAKPEPGEKSQVTQDIRKDQKKNKTKKPRDINAEKLQTRNVPFERTPKYVSGDGTTTMTLLKDTLNRFRLLGPRAYTVLSSATVPANVVVEEEMEETTECEEAKGLWWKHYYGEEGRLQSHQKQVAAWKQLACCSHPPGKIVLPLTVRDPRVTLPTKKVPMLEEDSGSDHLSSYLAINSLLLLHPLHS